MAGCFLSILDFLLLCFLCKICLQYNTEAQQGKEITFVGSVFYLFILFIIFFFFYQKCVIGCPISQKAIIKTYHSLNLS